MSDYSNQLTCPKCGHTENSSTAKRCEICGSSLQQSTSLLPVMVIGGLVLLGIGAGGLYTFKDQIFGNKQVDSPSASTTLNPTSSPSGIANPSTSETPSTPSASAPPSTAEPIAAPAGIFNYGGSTTWAALRKVLDPILQKEQPQFKLRYTDPPSGSPGSGSGIKMLLEGQLAFSQSSRPLKDAEFARAKERGYTITQIPVAIDGLAFAVNPRLKISGLTITQIQQIYLGKITNWSQVGGPSLPIIPYSRRPEEGGTVQFFVDNVLEGKNFGTTVKFIGSTTESLREVAMNPGGLYYASAPEVVPQCMVLSIPVGRTPDTLVSPYQEPLVPLQDCPKRRNTLNVSSFKSGQYPITRQLFVIVKQNGQAEQQAGEAYANWALSPEGQSLIAQAGFIPIR